MSARRLEAVFGERRDGAAEPGATVAGGHELDLAAALRGLEGRLCELVELESGQLLAVPVRYVFTPTRYRHPFKVTAGDTFHALKVDNYSETTTLYVGFTSEGGQPGQWDELVPPLTGRILTRPYDQVSIGVNPQAAPAQLVVPVVFYSRPIAPITYDLRNAGADLTPVAAAGEGPLTVANVPVSLTPPAGARGAMITVEGNPIRYFRDGTNPTSDPSGAGHLLYPGDALELGSDPALFRAIEQVVGSPAVVQVSYF